MKEEKKYGFYGWETADVKDKNGLTPRDYYDLLSGAWSAETCAPRMRDEWTRQNKTLGQCSVTAFLIQDQFGGKVYGVKLDDGNFHCFNEVDGVVFDLTSEQFGSEKLDYTDCPEQFREIHFKKTEKLRRYELLKENLAKEFFKREADAKIRLLFIARVLLWVVALTATGIWMYYSVKLHMDGIFDPYEYASHLRPVLYGGLIISIASVGVSFALYAQSRKLKRKKRLI